MTLRSRIESLYEEHEAQFLACPEFRALEAELYGADVASARAELRSLGPRLKRVGRLL